MKQIFLHVCDFLGGSKVEAVDKAVSSGLWLEYQEDTSVYYQVPCPAESGDGQSSGSQKGLSV